MQFETPWDEEREALLRELWTTGLSAAEIGRRIGVSKNAVIGKRKRLDLPPRPSPLQRIYVKRESKPKVAGKVTLAPLPSVERPVKVAPTPKPAAPAVYKRIVSCCWPIGHPGTASFRFCGEQSDPGRPYCLEHAKLAYVKPRKDAMEWAA